MKYLLALLTVFILFGCSTENEKTETQYYKAIGENQVYANSALQAQIGAVIVTRLEDLNSPTGENEKDTGGRGVDAIPLKIDVAGTYTFIKDNDINCTVKIYDKNSSQFTVVLGDTEFQKNITLSKGDYILQFLSSVEFIDTTSGFQNIFLYPAEGSNNIFNLRLSRYSCKNAYLSEIDLSNFDLQKVDLSGSDISSANLRNIDLKESVCVGTNFHSSVLFAGRLVSANFQTADFTSSDLQYCYLSYSDFRGAKFCQSNHYGYIITGAITDGTTKCWNE